ncbi:heat-shock protein IbpA [Aureimonas sp. SA4125]|uniref:Hsp20 family protein n=1 Tax=Aureimonas sp. SA4125 TaxID=2826993 RepID=UPI001CC53ADD|nr:Hsp20 family protein [Aureimonas sp. SA4125]BDA83487.1 heat-shock protein IbpA [Aureimonas sp. SA4125]
MRTIDFAPLYRSTVGFDRLFAKLDTLAQPGSAETYPPYNIERTGENAYRVTLAVAGFGDRDLQIELREGVLTVTGEKAEDRDAGSSEVLYRGIAGRSFERRFQLADHVEVQGASLKNGLLHVDLVRVIPEALKPRKIDIAVVGNENKQIEANAA